MEVPRKITSRFAASSVSPFFIRLAKCVNRFDLDVEELQYIATAIKRKAPCRVLVFGLGKDSLFWTLLNEDGETVFLEDNPAWYKKIMRRYPHLSVFLVNYNTLITQWQELLEAPDKLRMDLLQQVGVGKYDCILVDGPSECNDSTPGRMKSIFAASQLVNSEGDISVHDCNRIVEAAYCDRYLGRKHYHGLAG
jgi:hypothetical protein